MDGGEIRKSNQEMKKIMVETPGNEKNMVETPGNEPKMVETIVWQVFTVITGDFDSFQAFLGGAKWISSIHSIKSKLNSKE